MGAAMQRKDVEEIFHKKLNGDIDLMRKELMGTGANRLKEVCEAMNVKMGQNKESAVENVIKAFEVKEKTIVLKVDETIFNMVPRPSEQDYNNLKQSIKERGLRTTIKVFADMTIVDGHTRYQALQELGIPITEDMIEVIPKNKHSIEEVVYDNNLARRHLTNLEKIIWAKKYFGEIIKKEVEEETRVQRGKEISKSKKEGPKQDTETRDKTKKTSTRIAEKANVPATSVEHYDWLEKYAPRLLKKGIKEKKEINEIYNEAHAWWDEVKKKDPKMFKSVQKLQIDLEQAYNSVKDIKEEKEEPERKPGKLEKEGLKIRDIFVKTFTGYEGDEEFKKRKAKFLERLDIIIANHIEKNH